MTRYCNYLSLILISRISTPKTANEYNYLYYCVLFPIRQLYFSIRAVLTYALRAVTIKGNDSNTIMEVPPLKTKVMLICHGNICRSPMAEFILKDMVRRRGIEDDFVIASSATSREEIWGEVGNPVYPPAQRELAAHGISCEGKRAVQLTKGDYKLYDYLLCMDKNNLRNAKRIVGHDRDNKLRLLLSYAGGGDIADPWYCGNLGRTYADIVRGCEGLLRELGY